MHTLFQPNTLSENFTGLQAEIFETLEQLQPVAWHHERVDTGVEQLLECNGSKEANKVIANGLFSELSETRDGVRVWKAHFAFFFFLWLRKI